MKKILEKSTLFLHKKYDITPEILSYIKIFSAPWVALLISKIISSKSLTLAILTLLLYILAISTDFIKEILNKTTLHKIEKEDNVEENIFDQIIDRVFIIFILIPFGFNLFTSLIILAESISIFQTLYYPTHKKQINKTEKIKIILQTLLIPILILQTVTNLIPDMAVYVYIIITIIYTCMSVYSKYFYFKD